MIRIKINILKNLLKGFYLRYASMYIIGFASLILDLIGIALVMPFIALLLDYDLTTILSNSNYVNGIFKIIISRFSFEQISVLLIIVFVIKNTLRFFISFENIKIGNEMRANWMEILFKKYIHSNISLFIDIKHGALQNNLFNLTQDCVGCFRQLVFMFVSFVTFCITFLILINLAFKVTIIFLIIIILVYSLINSPLIRKYMELGNLKIQFYQAVNEIPNDAFKGIREIKVYSGESIVISKYINAVKNMSDLRNRLGFFRLLPPSYSEALFIILLLGAIILLNNSLSIQLSAIFPLMVTYIYASQRLFSNVSGFVSNFNEFINKWPSVLKLHNEINDKVRSENDSGSKIFINTNSNLILKNICFSIDDSLIINDLNCTFNNGDMTAIVGESGSGKSTITDLIMRIHSADSGLICYDDYNVNEYSLSSWRRNIGYVGQESFLFSGSIFDNIAFGLTSNINKSQIVTAAKKANAHEFIIQKENGYETLVGERGSKLSVGEKQRISIARALVRKPKIIIFDEPTSALDYQNEKLIIDTMNKIKKGLILIIIAHKITVLENADKILIIKRGEKIDEGTHDELFLSNNEFNRLFKKSILP